LTAKVSAFLHFCRVEKGLAPNSIASYGLDLKKLLAFEDDIKVVGRTAKLSSAIRVRLHRTTSSIWPSGAASGAEPRAALTAGPRLDSLSVRIVPSAPFPDLVRGKALLRTNAATGW